VAIIDGVRCFNDRIHWRFRPQCGR